MSQRQKYTIAGLLSLLLASLCMFFIKVQHVTGAMMLALLIVGLIAGYTAIAFIVSSFTKHPQKTLHRFFDFFDAFFQLPF